MKTTLAFTGFQALLVFAAGASARVAARSLDDASSARIIASYTADRIDNDLALAELNPATVTVTVKHRNCLSE